MNRKLVFALSLFVLLCSSPYVRFNSVEVESSNGYPVAPDFILTDIEGNSFSLSDYHGRTVLLDFFHTNCTPSVNQFSELMILHEDFAEKLVIISTSTENETILMDFREAYSINWTIARDTSNVFDMYNVSYIPTLVIIDQDGYIRYRHEGLTEESMLRPEIESLLPKTIYVDDDNVAGPWNGTKEHPYQNITSGVEHASDNDTVFVQNGTYYEHFVVNKSISLIGEDRATTIIDAGKKDTVVSVTTDNVTVSRFTIRNAGGYLIWSCIELGASKITIKDNIITASYIGILAGGDHNTIIDNTIVATGAGMVLHHSRGNILRNNTMIDNVWSNFAVWGESLSHFFQDIDTSNLVDGKPIYYFVNQSNLIVNSSTSPDIGYLAIINSTKVTVRDLDLKTRNDEGILLAWTTKSIIQNVNVSNNHQGVSLRASCDNMIANNTISDNYYGISLGVSNNNEVIDNEISSTTYGINLASSEGNRIKDNVVRSSRDSGILVWGSNYNVISNNAILENHYGIRLGNFVSRPESTGNFIVGNFISNNDQQVGFENPHYSSNTWDNGYPAGGNYWRNYTGVDSDHDGIGDSWYHIQENNIDHYPLMGKFSDFNATSEYRVQTICNSSISDFQFSGTAISFNVSGESGTIGFCRVCIPRALINETYKVFVNGTGVPHTLLLCSNSTHSYLYFSYNHSTQEVVIVPEFPSLIILPLFMIATLPAVIVYKRKHTG